MNWFAELSLKRKIILLIFFIALIAQVIAFTILSIERYNYLKTSLKNQAQIYARLIAEYSISPLIFEDMEGLKQILLKTETLPDVLMTAVYNKNGNLVEFYLKKNTGNPPPDKERFGNEFVGGTLHVRENIVYNNVIYGSVHLKVSTAQITDEITGQILLFFIIGLSMSILIYILANRFQYFISNPIVHLAKTASLISKEADYSVRLEERSSDEIGQLYQSFNNMIDQIGKRSKERDLAHDKLKHQYNRFLAILNAFPEGVYVVDPETYKILFANTTLEEKFRKQLVGKKCYDVLYQCEQPCTFCDNYSLMQGGESITWEYFNPSLQAHFLLTGKLIKWPDGSNVRMEIASDITERKKNEEELRKYREHLEDLVKARTAALEATNKELEAFAYSVSHDLRAPLRAISGYTQILYEEYIEKLDDEGKRIGGTIQKNTKKMSQLIDDLLALSRLGRVEIKKNEIDMQDMVLNVFEELVNPEEAKRIRLTVNKLPKAMGDRNLLRQVWTNLLSNAVKFTSNRKQAKITISAKKSDNKTTYMIRDNGAGFNMRYADKLFGVFQRLHSENEFKGTGVGLALVQRILHRHGGTIWAEAKENTGATFYFSLPLNVS